MRVSPADYLANQPQWAKVYPFRRSPRPDEQAIVDELGGVRVPQPIYYGNLALQLLPDEERDLWSGPLLSWPPESGDYPRAPGRPRRVDELWSAVSLLQKASASAILVVGLDIRTNVRQVHLPARGHGFLIERTKRYYSAHGDLSEGAAEQALQILTHHLRMSKISIEELDRADVKVRKLRSKQRHGQHLFVSGSALEDLQEVIERLPNYGITRPSTSRPLRSLGNPIPLDPVRKGKNTMAICPLHEDHDPSLQLNISGLAWCYGSCGGAVGRWDHAEDGSSALRPFVDGDAAMVRAASKWRPSRAQSPTSCSYVGTGSGEQPRSSELGSSPPRPYSATKAAMAGNPAVDPAQIYLGHYGGRAAVAKMPITEKIGRFNTPNRGLGAPRILSEVREFGLVWGRKQTRYMRQQYERHMDLLDVLKSAERVSKFANRITEANTAYWQAKAEHRRLRLKGALKTDRLPDQYVSRDYQQHTKLRKGWDQQVCDGVITHLMPSDFIAIATKWVLFDIDDIKIPETDVKPVWSDDETLNSVISEIDKIGGEGCTGDKALLSFAGRVQKVVERHPDYTGRIAVIRTGPTGVQVIAELTVARWDPDALWQSKDFRAQVEALGQIVMDGLHDVGCAGGFLDPSAFAANRLMRRPSWRITKDDRLFRSRLIFSSP